MRVAAAIMLLAPTDVIALDICISPGKFSSSSRVKYFQEGSTEETDFRMEAELYSRSLIESPDSYWVGYQFLNVFLFDGERQVAPNFYMVPFAVEIDRDSGEVRSSIFNGPLKEEDISTVLSLYETFHSVPSSIVASDSPLAVIESNQLGVAETLYESSKLGEVHRRRLALRSRSDLAQGREILRAIRIIEDSATFFERSCHFREMVGQSQISMEFATGLAVTTFQQNSVSLVSRSIPKDLRLVTLDYDPKLWEPLESVAIYQLPDRKPLASEMEFLDAIGLLAFSKSIDVDALALLIFNNDGYLGALRPLLAAGDLGKEFERQLILRIGKASTKNSRQLLSSLITDSEINENTRFASIMGLRYTNDPLESDLQDSLFSYLNEVNLSARDRGLADSALLALGTISGSTKDVQLNERIISRLTGAVSESGALVAMSALGNSGLNSSVPFIGDFASSDNRKLRHRAAETLGVLVGGEAKDLLVSRLGVETDPLVLSAVVDSLGQQVLSENELRYVASKADGTQPVVIRRAAIRALANQSSSVSEAKVVLKNLLPNTTDRVSVETIMHALYGNE